MEGFNFFNVLTLIGGLCLFLFGMSVMGDSLERRAGNSLRTLLAKLTTNKFVGFLTGLGVTSVIQSSSATTVMVVGFVNSGIMTLRQATSVIIGANVGTTVTAWILSLGGIEGGGSLILELVKPMSFTPVLAMTGIILYMFCKGSKNKDTGSILLGFAVLMFGMDIMSGAVSGLKDVPAFTELFIMFKNPILGMLAGAVLTAIIQSSSASVGILQALSMTGAISYGAVIPIVMGQGIGTCITAMLSSVGTNRNAKRAAIVHLSFNVIGTALFLSIFSIVKAIAAPAFFDVSANPLGIAVAHTSFKLLCTLVFLPASSLLEKISYILIPETEKPDIVTVLDERLLGTPAVALEQCRTQVCEMSEVALCAMERALSCFKNYDKDTADEIRRAEDKTDKYEDIIGTYLVKLSANQVTDHDSAEAAKLLKIIGDLERISDHAVNILESAEELAEKQLSFSDSAASELDNISAAIFEILNLTKTALIENDLTAAATVEPLEQVVDGLKENMRNAHVVRLQQGACSIETGFVWSDILTNLERTSDHCSNIAGCVIDAEQENLNLHESLRLAKRDSEFFKDKFAEYSAKYLAV